MGEATHPGWGIGVGAAQAGTLAAACCGKACEAAKGQHGLITRDASDLILPFGFGSARGNLEGAALLAQLPQRPFPRRLPPPRQMRAVQPLAPQQAADPAPRTETTRVEEWEKDGTVALRTTPVTMSCDGLGLTAGRRA